MRDQTQCGVNRVSFKPKGSKESIFRSEGTKILSIISPLGTGYKICTLVPNSTRI